jgi:hypothetical protein
LNEIGWPFVPGFGETVKLADSPPPVPTTTIVEPDPVAPELSVAVAVTAKVPDDWYTCCALVAAPVSVVDVPSPQFKTIDVIALPLAVPPAGVAEIVNATAVPGVGLAVDELIVTMTWGRGPTVTDADA